MNGLPEHSKPRAYNVPPLFYKMDHEDEILREYHKLVKDQLNRLQNIKHGFSTKEIILYTCFVSFFWIGTTWMVASIVKSHFVCDVVTMCSTILTLVAIFWIAKTRKEWKSEPVE